MFILDVQYIGFVLQPSEKIFGPDVRVSDVTRP